MTLIRNSKLIWLSAISIVLLQTACVGSAGKNVKASSGSKPGWVNNSDAGYYPNSQYLTATGSASKIELAKDRALGNLVKTFEVEVRESTTTRSDINVSVRDGSESYTKNQRLNQQINLRTDKVVQGARVAETWFDKPVQTYHALAVLDRTQAGANIRGEMARLDQETDAELTRSGTQSDPLLTMASLNKAMELQNERLALQKSLKVIDTSGQGKPAQWNLAELRGQLESQLQSLRISSEVDNDPLGRLAQALRSAMGNAGFPAVNGSSDFTLVAGLDVQDLGLRDGWYWLRAKLSVKLVESSGKIRGRKQWPLKVSAQQRNEAESRLMTEVSKKLNLELKDSIIAFATGVN